jgi:hypothetical protein
MGGIRTILLIGICAVCSAGCLTRQVGTDGKDFRQALLDMYTDQLMDNLVRASQNQPFVQLAYRNLIVTDGQLLKVNDSSEYDPATLTSVATATSALLVSMKGWTERFILGGSLERDRTMQFQADPVAGRSDIFDYYQAFAADPTLFCVSAKEPDCPVYIKRKGADRWFWVPADAGGVFLQLALKTTFMLGPETPPPVYYSTRIVRFEPQYVDGWPYQPPPQPARYDANGSLMHPPAYTNSWHVYKYAVTVDPAVPNDFQQGHDELLIALNDCRVIKLRVAPNNNTNQTVATLKTESTYPLDPAVLTGRPAKFYSSAKPNLNASAKSLDQQRLDAAVATFRSYRGQQR